MTDSTRVGKREISETIFLLSSASSSAFRLIILGHCKIVGTLDFYILVKCFSIKTVLESHFLCEARMLCYGVMKHHLGQILTYRLFLNVVYK